MRSFQIYPYGNILNNIAKNTSETLLKSISINELNDLIKKQILEAIEQAVPRYRNSNSLPKNIVDLIKKKKEIKNSMKNGKSENLRVAYNSLTKQVKILIKEYRNKVWINFLDKLGPYPVNCFGKK